MYNVYIQYKRIERGTDCLNISISNSSGKPIYSQISEQIKSAIISGALEEDEMLPRAIEVVVETGQASVSMLQRRLKLGYSRAARLVDQMAERGIVGPFEGSKPRQVLITREQWQEMVLRKQD